jgi:putative hydrolase of the HAD superfamily
VLPLLDEPIGTDEQLDALFASGYLAAYERSWRAFDDAAPALAALTAAGYRLGVLTNGSDAQQRQKLRAIGLLEAVGPVWSAEAIGVAKPHPEAFRIACSGLAEPPASVLYVGDQHDIDVLGARSAGLPAVLLDRDGSAPPGETAVIHSLAELPAVLLHAAHDVGGRADVSSSGSSSRRSRATCSTDTAEVQRRGASAQQVVVTR